MRLWFLACCLLTQTACASIVSGTSQNINVTSGSVSGALCTLLTEDGGDYFTLESGPTALAGVGLQFPAGQFVTFGFEVEGGVTYEPPQGLRARVGGLLVVGFRFAP